METKYRKEARSLISGLEISTGRVHSLGMFWVVKATGSATSIPQHHSDQGLALAQAMAVGPAAGEGPHSPEDPSGAG